MEPVLPPLMGMFCTGYVLHRARQWWYQRRLRKQLAQIQLMQIAVHGSAFNIVWADWTPEVRRAA